jgi:hypothetical protein
LLSIKMNYLCVNYFIFSSRSRRIAITLNLDHLAWLRCPYTDSLTFRFLLTFSISNTIFSVLGPILLFVPIVIWCTFLVMHERFRMPTFSNNSIVCCVFFICCLNKWKWELGGRVVIKDKQSTSNFYLVTKNSNL